MPFKSIAHVGYFKLFVFLYFQKQNSSKANIHILAFFSTTCDNIVKMLEFCQGKGARTFFCDKEILF